MLRVRDLGNVRRFVLHQGGKSVCLLNGFRDVGLHNNYFYGIFTTNIKYTMDLQPRPQMQMLDIICSSVSRNLMIYSIVSSMRTGSTSLSFTECTLPRTVAALSRTSAKYEFDGLKCFRICNGYRMTESEMQLAKIK